MKEILFVAGGGNEIDSKQLDDLFVNTIKNRGGKGIAYIPIAMEPYRFPQCLEWFTSVFKDRAQIEMWTDLQGKTKEDIMKLGGIYIGGGNVVRLLKAIREYQFDRTLKEYIEAGGLVYGGSAGAIILGKDVRTASEVQKYELNDYSGLNLLGEYSISCHFLPNQTTYYKNLSRQINSPIIALSNQNGAIVSNGTLETSGESPVYIITPNHINTISPTQIVKIK